MLGSQLVDYTTEGPNVAFGIIGFVLPDLWACIVWSPSLCLKQSKFGYFTDIEVAQLDGTIFA